MKPSLTAGWISEFQKDLVLGFRTFMQSGTAEQIHTATVVRYHVTKKVNLFAGTESQYGTNLITGEQELLRVNLNFGVGYEVDEDFMLEMGCHP
ncbi:MAG: hypothetical protein AAGL34_09750 [Bacteroidota bacterium]